MKIQISVCETWEWRTRITEYRYSHLLTHEFPHRATTNDVETTTRSRSLSYVWPTVSRTYVQINSWCIQNFWVRSHRDIFRIYNANRFFLFKPSLSHLSFLLIAAPICSSHRRSNLLASPLTRQSHPLAEEFSKF